jgi:hypothetical protein
MECEQASARTTGDPRKEARMAARIRNPSGPKTLLQQDETVVCISSHTSSTFMGLLSFEIGKASNSFFQDCGKITFPE